MFKTTKSYILPCDGIAGDELERREVPLTGFFAVSFGKNNLERALCVSVVSGKWEVFLDGAIVAIPSADWKKAFGVLYRRAEKSNGILLGRPLSVDRYLTLLKARASDTNGGIDLSEAVDLNRVAPPNFGDEE